MKINSFGFNNNSLNFGDALSKKQEEQYLKVIKEIDEAIKPEQGKNGIKVFKIYTPAIPSSEFSDVGIGKPNSSQAKRIYEMARVYGGASTIKHMPMGQLTDKQGLENKYAGAYQRSALSFCEDVIDLFQLADEKYGYILPYKVACEYKTRHQEISKGENYIDFDTTLGWRNQEDYPINKALRIAFSNFKTDENPNEQLVNLRNEFEKFKNQKQPVDYDDIYTRLALFPYIKDWGTGKTDFFIGFDSDINVRMKKMPEYNALKEKYKNEIEFFKFKQFLAHRAILDSKEMVNSSGMDLMIDCPIAFSWVEEQVFPDAFLKDQWGRSAEIGWGIHAINYFDLANKNNSPAHKLLRAKVAHCLQNYDGIRFDVGWSYMNPSFHFGDRQMIRFDAGTKITDFIEKIAKEIKGADFDQRKLMYECDAGGDDFNLWINKDKIRGVKGLAILSTEEEKNDDANIGWGSLPFIKYNIGLRDDDFILGTNNHDKEGVLRCALNKDKSSEHVGALMRVFNKRPQDGYQDGWRLFKDDYDKSEHVKKYSRARFAEVESAKNRFVLFTDMLGRGEKLDYHGKNNDKDYKMRLERDFEKNYHKALQDGVGYNAADVRCFMMEMSGLDRRFPQLYLKAKKYSEYLKHKGGIYTQEQANNSQRANLNIEGLSLDEIRQLDFVS